MKNKAPKDIQQITESREARFEQTSLSFMDYYSCFSLSLQFSALSHRLKAVMLEYNQLEQDHRESVKRLITRQLETGAILE